MTHNHSFLPSFNKRSQDFPVFAAPLVLARAYLGSGGVGAVDVGIAVALLVASVVLHAVCALPRDSDYELNVPHSGWPSAAAAVLDTDFFHSYKQFDPAKQEKTPGCHLEEKQLNA
mgnify:CR=1 FL=1